MLPTLSRRVVTVMLAVILGLVLLGLFLGLRSFAHAENCVSVALKTHRSLAPYEATARCERAR